MKPTSRVTMGTPCLIPPPTSGAPGAFLQGEVVDRVTGGCPMKDRLAP